MKKQFHEACLGSFDFSDYLSGTAGGYEKAAIEQHLSVCETCFDTFINAFNWHLDHASLLTDSQHDLTRTYQFA